MERHDGREAGGRVRGRLSQSTIRGLTVGVSASGSYQTVTDSDIEATGATESTYGVSSVGSAIASSVTASGQAAPMRSSLRGPPPAGRRPELHRWMGVRARGATRQAGNVTFAENRCFGGEGPKIVAMGAGWTIVNNYLGWERPGGASWSWDRPRRRPLARRIWSRRGTSSTPIRPALRP
jgi:hypothetical protein